MTNQTHLLGGLLVLTAAIVVAAPSANAVNFGPMQSCASWTGAGHPIGRHECSGDPLATKLVLGSVVDINNFCFGPEGREVTFTSMLPGTGTLSFTWNLMGIGPPAFDWAFVTVGGVTTRINNPDPFVCDNGNHGSFARPDTGQTIVIGVHEDGWGDPLCFTATNINT